MATCVATERAGRYEPIASVVRNNSTSAPSASTTSAITWPGSAVSSAFVSSSAACAVPVLPTVAARSSAIAAFDAPRRPAMPRTARACMPVTISLSTWSGLSSAAFERGVPRLLGQRRVLDLAEALFPRA